MSVDTSTLTNDSTTQSVAMTPFQLLGIYKTQRDTLDVIREHMKKQSSLVKESEHRIINIMQQENRVVVPYDDIHDIHLQNRRKKPSSNVERFTDILFDIETAVNHRSESEVHQYIDMLLEKVEKSRTDETVVVPAVNPVICPFN